MCGHLNHDYMIILAMNTVPSEKWLSGRNGRIHELKICLKESLWHLLKCIYNSSYLWVIVVLFVFLDL